MIFILVEISGFIFIDIADNLLEECLVIIKEVYLCFIHAD